MFTIGITKGRWNTLLTALQQFKDDYDRNQPMWRILPEFCRRSSALRAHGPARPVPEHPRDVRQGRHRAADHRDVPVGPAAGDEAERRLRLHRAPQDRAGRRSTSSKAASRPPADAVPAGHSAADPGRGLQPQDRRLPAVHARVQRRSSRASTPTSTGWSRRTATAGARATTSTACAQTERHRNPCAPASSRGMLSVRSDRTIFLGVIGPLVLAILMLLGAVHRGLQHAVGGAGLRGRGKPVVQGARQRGGALARARC